MAVRSKLLVFQTASTSTALYYTAGSGETTLVKRLHATNVGVLAAAMYTLVRSDSLSPWNYLGALAIAAGQQVNEEMWMVLPEGYQLGVQVVGGPIHFMYAGAELEGLAD